MERLDGVHIVVVDDSEEMRDLMGFILSRNGASVQAVGAVDEALGVIETDVPDLLISDIQMPVKSGFDLIRAVRTDARFLHVRFLPALAVSSESKPLFRLKAFQEGFLSFVAKPFDGNHLVGAVGDLVRQTSPMLSMNAAQRTFAPLQRSAQA